MSAREHKPISVLVVDDSAVVRMTMSRILDSAPDIEVIGVAADPLIAAEKIRLRVPDVIMLDIEMPRMDGLTFLQKVMTQHPIPVVVCSALTTQGAKTTMRALELGAVEIIAKPQVGTKQFLEESVVSITDAVRAAAQAKLGLLGRRESAPDDLAASVAVAVRKRETAALRTTNRIIAVGASTGGTEAIRVVLSQMPLDCPGLVIVQHMPAGFTRQFAERLNQLGGIEVREARDGDAVITGRALIAPGNEHMVVRRDGARYAVQLRGGEPVSRHRPSVDVLFGSVAEHAGANAVGVLMTGMGDDGARGLLEMREAGARTLAQDEATSIVFGMPAEAIKRGAAEEVVALPHIADRAVALSEE